MISFDLQHPNTAAHEARTFQASPDNSNTVDMDIKSNAFEDNSEYFAINDDPFIQ